MTQNIQGDNLEICNEVRVNMGVRDLVTRSHLGRDGLFEESLGKGNNIAHSTFSSENCTFQQFFECLKIVLIFVTSQKVP